MSKTVICPKCNNSNSIDVPINKYTKYKFSCIACDEAFTLDEYGSPKTGFNYMPFISGLLSIFFIIFIGSKAAKVFSIMNKNSDSKKEQTQLFENSKKVDSDNQKLDIDSYRFKGPDESRTNEEALIEWEILRKNPDMVGKIVNWKIDVAYILNGNIFGFPLFKSTSVSRVGALKYKTAIIGRTNYLSYKDCIGPDKFPVVRADDLILVKGRFSHISEDGRVVLNALNVKNLGYYDE